VATNKRGISHPWSVDDGNGVDEKMMM